MGKIFCQTSMFSTENTGKLNNIKRPTLVTLEQLECQEINTCQLKYVVQSYGYYI